MNQTNLCSGLEIVDFSFDNPFEEMYKMQRILQLKHMSYDATSTCAKTAALNCVYWLHCVSAELLVELMGWFEENEITTALTHEQRLKEIQMEAIDSLHFAMNIGLELQIGDAVIQAMGEKAYIGVNTYPHKLVCSAVCDKAVKSGITLIDCMPWKKWKSYDELTIDDVRGLSLDNYTAFYGNILNVCGAVGLDRDQIVSMYCAKNKENFSRQENGY